MSQAAASLSPKSGEANAGTFGQWQPIYAERDVATFPVNIDGTTKRPAVRNYLRIGKAASQKLAVGRFSSAASFGFVAGKRSGITVLDVDSGDERELADALDRHGKTPLIVKTGSGHYQAWYRWRGEGRMIRPEPTRPIDILGGGFVVAPPSSGTRGPYQILTGGLDDIGTLPHLKNAPATQSDAPVGWAEMRDGAGRNDALFRRLAQEAHRCDDYDQVLDRARTLNSDFAEPMDDAHIVRTARSVWRMTIEGRNRFGQHGAWFPLAEVERLVADPYLHALLSFLRAKNGQHSSFMVADGLANVLNWPRRQFSLARRRALEDGWIVMVSPPANGVAAMYRWGHAQTNQIR